MKSLVFGLTLALTVSTSYAGDNGLVVIHEDDHGAGAGAGEAVDAFAPRHPSADRVELDPAPRERDVEVEIQHVRPRRATDHLKMSQDEYKEWKKKMDEHEPGKKTYPDGKLTLEKMRKSREGHAPRRTIENTHDAMGNYQAGADHQQVDQRDVDRAAQQQKAVEMLRAWGEKKKFDLNSDHGEMMMRGEELPLKSPHGEMMMRYDDTEMKVMREELKYKRALTNEERQALREKIAAEAKEAESTRNNGEENIRKNSEQSRKLLRRYNETSLKVAEEAIKYKHSLTNEERQALYDKFAAEAEKPVGSYIYRNEPRGEMLIQEDPALKQRMNELLEDVKSGNVKYRKTPLYPPAD